MSGSSRRSAPGSRFFLRVAVVVGTFAGVAGCDQQFHFDSGGIDAAPDTSPGGACSAELPCALPTLHCDLQTGACVGCLEDSDCAAQGKPVCVDNQCVDCSDDDECGQGKVCDPASDRCLSQCADADDCPASAPTCDLARGVCIFCIADSQCGADAPICDGSVGQCVKCLHDVQCPAPTPRCAWDGECVECEQSSDCPSGKSCDPVAHNCI